MIKNKKKGFTIVELVIVIAVIGILSAVLIPVFSGLVAKANLANDNALVKNINTQLAASEIDDGKNMTMYDALQDAKEAGYLVANINARSNNQLVWDSTIDRFALIDQDGNVVSGEINATKDYQLWKISNTVDAKYSTYYTGTETTVNTAKGFDAGENKTLTAINYANNAEAQNVVIRTNGGTLNINAENDVVNHYGEADKVNIIAVAGSSYHENGIVPNIEIAKGRLEIAQAAEVNTVVVTGNQVKVDTKDDAVEVKVVENVTPIEIKGTENTVNVKMVANLNNLTDGENVVLNADLTACQTITANNVTIDLNGHTINVNSTAVYVQGTGVELIGSGLVKSRNYIAIVVNENAGLTIDGIEAQGQEGAVMPCGHSTLVIKSGVFTAYDNAVIITNGSSDKEGRTSYRQYNITINGGVFNGYIQSSGYIACGIYHANDGVLTVNGGTFNIVNGCGILCRSGNTTVGENVVFNLTNNANNMVRGKVGDSKIMVLTGATIVKDLAANYPGGAPVVTNNSNYNVIVLESYAN